MKNKGFTLIEIMIVICIVGIISAIAIPAMMGQPVNTNSLSFGVNGTTETRCIDGYKFVVGRKGSVSQMMDENGHGVKCNSF